MLIIFCVLRQLYEAFFILHVLIKFTSSNYFQLKKKEFISSINVGGTENIIEGKKQLFNCTCINYNLVSDICRALHCTSMKTYLHNT